MYLKFGILVRNIFVLRLSLGWCHPKDLLYNNSNSKISNFLGEGFKSSTPCSQNEAHIQAVRRSRRSFCSNLAALTPTELTDAPFYEGMRVWLRQNQGEFEWYLLPGRHIRTIRCDLRLHRHLRGFCCLWLKRRRRSTNSHLVTCAIQIRDHHFHVHPSRRRWLNHVLVPADDRKLSDYPNTSVIVRNSIDRSHVLIAYCINILVLSIPSMADQRNKRKLNSIYVSSEGASSKSVRLWKPLLCGIGAFNGDCPDHDCVFIE